MNKRSAEDQGRTDQAKVTKAVNAHRAAFAVTAIAARVRTKDLTDFVLPALLDVAGMTELTDAAKLLRVAAVLSPRRAIGQPVTTKAPGLADSHGAYGSVVVEDVTACSGLMPVLTGVVGSCASRSARSSSATRNAVSASAKGP